MEGEKKEMGMVRKNKSLSSLGIKKKRRK